MIHQLLNLTRPLFVLDTETTGVDPKVDRIVEIGFQRYTVEGMTLEWKSLVNPGVPIPASATKVHGITDSRLKMCEVCGFDNASHVGNGVKGDHEFELIPPFNNFALSLAKGFSNCDYAGQNVRFDLRILSAEMNRASVKWSYADARIVDSSRLEALAVPRDLGSLHHKYTGAKHDGVHGATSDVRAAATVIAKQLETYPNLPRDLDKLHEEQWPGFLCDGGEFRMVDGVATIMFGKFKGKSMRDIPASYYDFILGADFPADVKALAGAAKIGNFPGETR